MYIYPIQNIKYLIILSPYMCFFFLRYLDNPEETRVYFRFCGQCHEYRGQYATGLSAGLLRKLRVRCSGERPQMAANGMDSGANFIIN